MKKLFWVLAAVSLLSLPGGVFASVESFFPTFGQETEVAAAVNEDEFRGQALQCTDFIYSKTGIARGMGNASQWDESARKRGYSLSSTPKDKSIGIIEAWNSGSGRYGHVYWVADSKKQDKGMYSLKIEHSNWEKSGKMSNYKDARFDKNTNKVSIHKGAYLPSGGFITKWKK